MACLLPLLSCCPLPEPLRANATRLLDCQAQIKLLTVGRRQMFVQHESTYNLQGQAARICLQDSQNGSTDHDANGSGGGASAAGSGLWSHPSAGSGSGLSRTGGGSGSGLMRTLSDFSY